MSDGFIDVELSTNRPRRFRFLIIKSETVTDAFEFSIISESVILGEGTLTFDELSTIADDIKRIIVSNK